MTEKIMCSCVSKKCPPRRGYGALFEGTLVFGAIKFKKSKKYA